MRTRARLLGLGLLLVLLVLAAATLVSLWIRAQRGPAERSTEAVARAYWSAIRKGDKEAALDLYRGDPLCSTVYANVSDAVDEQIALLGSAAVREMVIEVEPAQGVSYTPGSEVAVISFEYREGETWQPGGIWLVTGPPQDGMRTICYIHAALPLREED